MEVTKNFEVVAGSMLLENIKVESDKNRVRVSAVIDGEEIWFSLPGDQLKGSIGDAMIASAFFPAMIQGDKHFRNYAGCTLGVPAEYPVSPRFMSSVSELQDVFRSWVPRLRRFSLEASEAGSGRGVNGVASMFSGGVDSIFTLLKHRQEISHLIYIAGFEHVIDEEALARTKRYLESIAEEYDKQLIVVETNQLEFFQTLKIGRYLHHGSSLAAVAHLLGFQKVYIPSSDTYDSLDPGGSHPLTDPAWSSETVELVYDGGVENRIDKIAYLHHHSKALQQILVCWDLPAVNCCACNKCVRTMLAMELLGITSSMFPKALRSSTIRNARFNNSVDVGMFGCYLKVARSQGNSRLVRAMGWAEARVRVLGAVKSLINSLDDVVLAGRLQKWRMSRTSSQQWYDIPMPRR